MKYTNILPVEDMETTIKFKQTTNYIDIVTSDPDMLSLLDALCDVSPDYYKAILVIEGVDGIVAKSYKLFDKRLIDFRTRPKGERSDN